MSVKSKNIHVLPTDKEPVKGDLLLRHIWKDTSNECISWWRYDDTITIDGVVQYTTLNGSFRDITSSFKVQNIYITSDEEIKEGDWVIYKKFMFPLKVVLDQDGYHIINNGIGEVVGGYYSLQERYKKIIITTDQDLIKDGVQAIDDEFLNWFVKNPSCEWVEVEKMFNVVQFTSREFIYKIIIPKEEAKQEDCSCTDECLGYLTKSCKRIEEPKQELERGITITHVGKQETLEKAALNLYPIDFIIDRDTNKEERDIWLEGAKWQSEQYKKMYSEEEVETISKDAYTMGRNNILIGVFNKWFEQFKNK